ncbi:MAG: MFS transporter [Acidobacteria bacterium]|nr:MFS transporter [Acidobacteriota bacterium]
MPDPAAAPSPARIMKKIAWRILPLVFLLYVVAFIDRANVAYAKLTMTVDLGFSEAVFGLGAGIFFIGYLLLEVPGALIVQKWGARWWMARILVSWGICTILVGFVNTPNQFYVTRFLLGVAEAGFFPGVIVYLNEWFPNQYRARAMAKFIIASPIALTIGGPFAGALLQLDWFGMPGWRWVFIVEGVPAIVLGLLTPFLMTDRPRDAAWLKGEERDWLLNELEAEKRRKAAHGHFSIWQALRHRTVLSLAAITFLANIGIQGFFLWLPTTVQKASGLPAYMSAFVSGLPFAVAVAAMLLSSWSSDRTGERCLHVAIPLMAAAFIFPITTISTLSFGWLLFWLCLSSFAIYGFGPPFWTLPTLTLGESAAAAAIGFVNCFSGLGGFVGPVVVGSLLTAGYPFSTVVFFLSACFLASSAVVFSIRRRIVGHVKDAALASPAAART